MIFCNAHTEPHSLNRIGKPLQIDEAKITINESKCRYLVPTSTMGHFMHHPWQRPCKASASSCTRNYNGFGATLDIVALPCALFVLGGPRKPHSVKSLIDAEKFGNYTNPSSVESVNTIHNRSTRFLHVGFRTHRYIMSEKIYNICNWNEVKWIESIIYCC